jgi:hypothetical protein
MLLTEKSIEKIMHNPQRKLVLQSMRQFIFIFVILACVEVDRGFAQQQDTACTRTTNALNQATTLLSRLTSSQKRDSLTIDSLVQITRKAHDEALSCQSHLTAMMLLATSESARKLPKADNILMFRMAVRDTRLFLDEAKRYWMERR